MRNVTHLMNRKLPMLGMAIIIMCLVAFSKFLGTFLQTSEPVLALSSQQHGPVIFEHKSGSLPLFPIPGPLESSGKDEVESKDECDDDISKLVANVNAGKENRHSKDQLLFHLQSSLENRASVSLFVLYHCWKSLPSQIS